MTSPFVKPNTEYGRDLDILKAASMDAAQYLAIMEGIPLEEAIEFVTASTAKGGALEVVDPATRVLVRDKKKGRTRQVVPFSAFLQSTEEQNLLMAPTMTNYTSPHTQRSILSEYIDGNVAKRKVVKKAGQKDKANGDHEAAGIKHVLQSTFKIKNNSLSGAHLSAHNSLYLKSAHPTLTTCCRSATSLSNANTERFTQGNRHYRNADIAINNIVSVVQCSDYERIEMAMEAYGLHYPTADEVVAAVHRSTDQYWNSPERFVRIEEYIRNLTPLQRAAYLYSQDMYHLAKFNDAIVRKLITPFAVKATSPVVDAREWISKMDADVTALIGIVCAEELKGSTWWDLKLLHNYGPSKLHEFGCLPTDVITEAIALLKSDDPSKSLLYPGNQDDVKLAITIFTQWNKKPYDLVECHTRYGLIGAQVKQTYETIEKFSLLIKAFWCTDNPPPSMAHFPTSIRKSVIVSDTDSTIFTVQDWVKWYNHGELGFDEVSNGVGAAMVYLTSQTTVHLLAQLSGGMGVVPEHISKLEMKNEFFFPVLSLTTKAKHYFSYQSACEGNVYDELEPEYKGVSLKNSKIPKHIMKRFNAFTEGIMDDVMAGKKLSMRALLQSAVDVEDEITSSLINGKTEYLQFAAVKDKVSYKNPDSSPYVHYEMWEKVFAPKYGAAPPPPYVGVKLSLDIPNSTGIKVWLSKIQDPDIRHRMETWLTAQNKKDYKIAILPLEVVSQVGVPEELLLAKDIRKVCATLLEPFILVLESMGIYMKNTYNSKLPSDFLKDLPFLTEV